MIKLGYHPATWGGRMEGTWAGIACMAANDWDGFEYCGDLVADWGAEPEALKVRLEEHDIELASVYIGCGFVDADEIALFHERIEKTAEFCAQVGTEFVLIDGGRRNDKNEYSDEDFHRVADAANKAGELCAEAGVSCSWHQHWGSMFEFQENFDRLMEMTDPELVGCTPDTAQHALGDFDVVPAVRKYADRIRYIHFKDLDRKRRFIELGRGTVDFWGCWQALGQEEYDGWIVVDLDYTVLDPDESCGVNKAYFNEILGIRGERDKRCGDW